MLAEMRAARRRRAWPWRCPRTPWRSTARRTSSPSTWPCSRTSPRTTSTFTAPSRRTPRPSGTCSSCSPTRPSPGASAVVNADDPAGAEMVRGLDLPVLRFGLGEGAEVRALEHTLDARRHPDDGGRRRAGRLSLVSPLIGEHNVLNLLGAVAVGLALGLEPPAIAARAGRGGRRARPLRAGAGGAALPRRRRLRAHARRARARAGHRAQAHARPARRGVRLRRRPRSRQAAAHGRHRRPRSRPAWITSDNPRSERPEAIIDEIVGGRARVAGAAGALPWRCPTARRPSTPPSAGRAPATRC